MILWDEISRHLENEIVKCGRSIKAWGRDAYGRPKHDALGNLEVAQKRKANLQDSIRMLANARFVYEKHKG